MPNNRTNGAAGRPWRHGKIIILGVMSEIINGGICASWAMPTTLQQNVLREGGK